MHLVEFLLPSLIAVVGLIVQRATWTVSARLAITELIAVRLYSLFPGAADMHPVAELLVRFFFFGVLLTPFLCLYLSKRRRGVGVEKLDDNMNKLNGDIYLTGGDDYSNKDVKELNSTVNKSTDSVNKSNNDANKSNDDNKPINTISTSDDDTNTCSSITSILQRIQYEKGDVFQYDGEWVSGDWLHFLSKLSGYVVDRQTTTTAPIAIMEEAAPYAYSMFLGLAERGHPVLLLSPFLSPGSIASILREHRCEIILLNQSLLDVLESVLEMDHAISLRAIFCTENHYFHVSDMGSSLRAEEALEQEYDLPVQSLDYAMDAFCSEKGLDLETQPPSMATAGLEVATTPEKDAPAMILYREEGEGRVVSHGELMDAVERVMQAIAIQTQDVVLMEEVLSVDAFALFAACLWRHCRLSVMTSVDDCHCVSPTILAVSAATYGSMCEEMRSLSGLCRVMKRIHKGTLFGGRLRRCLVFSYESGVRDRDVESFNKCVHVETCVLWECLFLQMGVAIRENWGD